MYQSTQGENYLNIKEASALYDVSRAKIHRLITLGRLHSEPDPRDERARLINSAELEALFRLPKENEMYKYRETGYAAGRLTAATRDRLDALRSRVAMTGKRATDSVEIIREARAERASRPRV